MHVQIIDSFVTIFEAAIVSLFAGGYLYYKKNLKTTMLAIFIIAAFTKLFTLTLPPTPRTICSCIMCIIVAKTLFNTSTDDIVTRVIFIYVMILGSNTIGFQVLLHEYGYKNLVHMQSHAFSYTVLASPELIALTILLILNKKILEFNERVNADKKAKLLQLMCGLFLMFIITGIYQFNQDNGVKLIMLIFYVVVFANTVVYVLNNYVHIDIKESLLRQNQQLMQYIRDRNNMEGHILPTIHANITLGKLDEAKKQLEDWMYQNREFGYEKVFKENNDMLVLGFGECFFKGIEVTFEENTDLNETEIDPLDMHYIFSQIVLKFIDTNVERFKVSTNCSLIK